MGMDRRIGGKFLHPGPGYGGSCFPKDTRALASVARQFDSDCLIVDSVIEVNRRQQQSMVPKIVRLVGELSGKRIAVLGLAFKPETDDMREAPSVEIIRGLTQEGAHVCAYDPVAIDEARKVLPDIEYAEDEYSTVKDADALIFVTEWNQFRALDMTRIRDLMKSPKIADLRNICDPADMRELGFSYVGVGR
jgi:UDPglucose 6-dehydrogenase